MIAKRPQKLCALALSFAMCLSTVSYTAVPAWAATPETDTVTFDGSVEASTPAANAVDGNYDTYYNLNNPTDLAGKTLTIQFTDPHKGMEIRSGQNDVWTDQLSAPADIYVKVGQEYVKTDSVNTIDGVNATLEAPGQYVHAVSFGGYEATEVQVRFTGNGSGWQRIREITGVDTLALKSVSISGLPQDGSTLTAHTTPSLVHGVTYTWKLGDTVVSNEATYRVKSTDVGNISLTVSYDGTTLSTPAFPIAEAYTTVQGAAISHEGLRESLNGENLNLDKAVDGNENTMANINNTTDLKGKSVTVEYAQAPTGLRILSGNPGDKLTAPVEVYLSTDGTTFDTVPAATITTSQVTEDGDVRTHEVLFANPNGAKYVKLLFADNSPGGWSRIREIYGLNAVAKTEPGEESANLALNATAASSANETSNFTQDKANDGDTSTRWSSGVLNADNPQWLRLDFGEPTTFNCVRLIWEKSAGKAYQIQISDNGTDWTDVATVTDGQPSQTRTLNFDPVTARYVRVYITENFPDIWTCVSLYEMEVYNNSWDFIRTQAEAQLQNAANWNSLAQDVTLVSTSTYGATVTWSSDSQYLTVEDGVLKVTQPETTTQATLTATISYGENQSTYQIPVRILSKIDLDNTYDFNPTPQKIEMLYTLIDFDNVVVYYEPGIRDVTRARVEEVLGQQGVTFTVTENYDQSTLALGIHGSTQPVDANTTGYTDDLFTPSETKYDAHYVDINPSGRVTILGEDDDAVYYGLATLDAAMDTVAGQQLACATIQDYANMQYRGVVEGFYGKVYTVEDILSLFDYMEEHKMNTFVYGPKGDPYHLGNWRDEYPTTITDEQRFYGMMTQDDMRTIAAAAAANNISFVWSIHPAMQNGIDFLDQQSVEAGIADIMVKFDHMYDLGIRQFGVFVDDINTSVALQGSDNQAYMIAEVQRRLEATYNTADASEPDRVGGTFYVPSFYGLDFGTPAQLETNLGAFKRANEGNNVIMMMTGSGCWSPITNQALETIRDYTGKKPVMWWNYPVNDNIDDQLYMNRMNSVYGVNLDVVDGMGILSNPMNQAEASKVSLYGVADYTWNTSNFDVQGNWEESFETYTDDPAMQDALRLFASHAAKNQDHTDINSLFNAYKSDPSTYQAVVDEMQRIVDACQLIPTLKDSGDQKLVNLEEEIRPWVYRLNDMCQMIIDSLQALHGEESQRFEHLMNAILLSNGIDTLDKYKTESLEGQGTSQTISTYIVNPGALYILPFARTIMTQASQSFFTEAPGPMVFTNTNVNGWAMAKADNTFTVTDGESVTLTAGSYVQFDLAQLETLSSVAGLGEQGVQMSLDGKSWTDFTPGQQARYVRLMNNTAQEVSVDLTQVSITTQVVNISSVTSNVQLWEPNNHPTGNINDYNTNTFIWLVSQQKGTNLTVTYDALTTIDRMELATTTDGDRLVGQMTLEYQDADGNWISVGTVDSDNFVDGAIAISFAPVQAKAIRATVAEARSTNWLKITEFHGVSTDTKSVVTVNGVAESKLHDRNVMSFVQLSGQGEVVYNVYESIKASDLTLYNAQDAWDGVSVYAVTAQGQTLLKAGETLLEPDQALSNTGSRTYHADSLRGVTAFRIVYTNGLYLNEIEVKGSRFVALNTYGVQAQVDQAKAAAGEGGYTQASIAALQDAIAAVETILASNTLGEPVNQRDLDTALAAMNTAVDGRVPETPVTPSPAPTQQPQPSDNPQPSNQPTPTQQPQPTNSPAASNQPQVSGQPDSTTAPGGGDHQVSTGDGSDIVGWAIAWVAAALLLTGFAGVFVYRSKGQGEE